MSAIRCGAGIVDGKEHDGLVFIGFDAREDGYGVFGIRPLQKLRYVSRTAALDGPERLLAWDAPWRTQLHRRSANAASTAP